MAISSASFRTVLALLGSLSFSGCGGSSSTTTTQMLTPPVNTAVPSIYVGNGPSTALAYSVLQFTRGAQGSATPLSTLALPATFGITCLTTDSSGQIYVGGSIESGSTYTWEVLVYAAGASGSATPLRTILGSSTSFLTVSEITVDSSGLLYVLTNQPAPMVAVFSATAGGAATPVRLITGAATQIGGNPLGITVDNAGTIYVSNTGVSSNSAQGSVLAFTSTANGNATPSRVISGANTGFGALYGMDTDGSGNLYVLSTAEPEVPGGFNSTLEEFPATANGNVAPIRTIGGSNTGLTYSAVLSVDKTTGVIYASVAGTPQNPAVEEFAATANGNSTPIASFTSTAWTGSGYYGIALR
jgi:hypothetical protein